MKKHLAATWILVLVMGTGAPAAAEPQPHEGVVKSVEPETHTVAFEDGTSFRAATGVEVDGLKPGTRVIFYFYTYDGQRTVVSYEYVFGTTGATR